MKTAKKQQLYDELGVFISLTRSLVKAWETGDLALEVNRLREFADDVEAGHTQFRPRRETAADRRQRKLAKEVAEAKAAGDAVGGSVDDALAAAKEAGE